MVYGGTTTVVQQHQTPTKIHLKKSRPSLTFVPLSPLIEQQSKRAEASKKYAKHPYSPGYKNAVPTTNQHAKHPIIENDGVQMSEIQMNDNFTEMGTLPVAKKYCTDRYIPVRSADACERFQTETYEQQASVQPQNTASAQHLALLKSALLGYPVNELLSKPNQGSIAVISAAVADRKVPRQHPEIPSPKPVGHNSHLMSFDMFNLSFFASRPKKSRSNASVLPISRIPSLQTLAAEEAMLTNRSRSNSITDLIPIESLSLHSEAINQPSTKQLQSVVRQKQLKITQKKANAQTNGIITNHSFPKAAALKRTTPMKRSSVLVFTPNRTNRIVNAVGHNFVNPNTLSASTSFLTSVTTPTIVHSSSSRSVHSAPSHRSATPIMFQMTPTPSTSRHSRVRSVRSAPASVRSTSSRPFSASRSSVTAIVHPYLTTATKPASLLVVPSTPISDVKPRRLRMSGVHDTSINQSASKYQQIQQLTEKMNNMQIPSNQTNQQFMELNSLQINKKTEAFVGSQISKPLNISSLTSFTRFIR